MHYVLGDVHGYLTEFLKLRDRILWQDADAQFIITGDWIDRGPEVMETIHWAMENITPGGRYQSIRGNHEDMALKWFNGPFRQYDDLPEDRKVKNCPPRTKYDFSDRMFENGFETCAAIQPIIGFFLSLPITLSIGVISPWGVYQEYRIAHGWYPDWKEAIPDRELSYDEIHTIIWERNAALYGHAKDDYVIVHGHTPTLNDDMYLPEDPEPINPGLIAYRKNTINVDGGRPYRESEGRFCTLCGICLETMEEFFSDDIPDNYRYVMNKYQKEMLARLQGKRSKK